MRFAVYVDSCECRTNAAVEKIQSDEQVGMEAFLAIFNHNPVAESW